MFSGEMQKVSLEWHHRAEVDAVFRKERQIGKQMARKPSVIRQTVEADQVRVSRKRRESLVRRLCVARGVQRQHLPDAHPGATKVVGEAITFGTKVADAVRSGKRRRVKQNSARTWKFHS